MQKKIEAYLVSKFDPDWRAYQGPQRELFALETYNLSHDVSLVNKIFPTLDFDPDSNSYNGTWKQQLRYLRACWNEDQVDEVIASSFKRIKEGSLGGYNPKHDASTIATLSRCQFNTVEPQEPSATAGAGYNPEAGYSNEDEDENGSSD